MMQYSFPYPARVQSSVPTLHGLRHEPFVNIDGELRQAGHERVLAHRNADYRPRRAGADGAVGLSHRDVGRSGVRGADLRAVAPERWVGASHPAAFGARRRRA